MIDIVLIAQALRQIAEALSGLAQMLAGPSGAGQTPPMTVDQPTLTPDPSTPSTSSTSSTPIKPDETTAPRKHEPERPGIRIRDNVDGPSTAQTPPAPTERDVRDALTALCKAGRSEDAKNILGHYGATTLSEVDPRFYRDLIAEAQKITNSTTTKEAQ